MPTSNRIILTDVDGVLLEWERHFTDWMLQRSYYNNNEERIYLYKLLPNKQNTYEMAERFGLSVPEIRKEIREFNKSAWMATQSPMPDSQTSDVPAQKVRKKRLGELFGDHIFKNYHILDTGADKDSALAEFHNTGLYWVEDKPKNALAGLKYGLKPILIDHEYNRDFNHDDIIRVSNWEEIHKLLSGRK